MEENLLEIGGYLPLEIGCLGGKENEPFNYIEEADKLRFNSARYAICYAVWEGGYKKIYIPIYMCISVKETLERYHIEYDMYSIDDSFMPILDKIEEDACILICNYYGIQGDEWYAVCLEKYRNIIFDNTQAFFKEPVLGESVYNVYSPRKFVGCIDGAYLIKKKIKKKVLNESKSWERGGYLLKSLDGGTNYAYSMYLQSEDSITEEGICGMSLLTQKYLDAIQYEKIKVRRKKNFRRLVIGLNDYNQLEVSDKMDVYPMVYPFLPKYHIDRNWMIQKRIYVAQWWKWVIEEPEASSWEKDLSIELLPLPIDHRYGKKEMEYLCAIIKEFEERNSI